jgi:hypothetical protein
MSCHVTIIQGFSKRDLQLYSKCYYAASVTKTFTLKGTLVHWSKFLCSLPDGDSNESHPNETKLVPNLLS